MEAANDNFKPERIRCENVAAIIGAPLRTVQVMAARGELPSAAKIGRRWSFNEDAIRAWLKQKEMGCQSDVRHQPLPTGAAMSFGVGLGLRVNPRTNGHLEQTIQRLRRDVSRRGRANLLAA